MPSRPVVAHVIDSLGHGGAEHQLVSNVLALGPDFEAVVFCLGQPNDLAARLRQAGVRVVEMLGRRALKSDVPGLALRLHRELSRLRPALLHMSLFLADLVGGVAGSPAASPRRLPASKRPITKITSPPAARVPADGVWMAYPPAPSLAVPS